MLRVTKIKYVFIFSAIISVMVPLKICADETINLPTYDPSPFGGYRNLSVEDRLQINPQGTPPTYTANEMGAMYVDANTGDLLYCTGTEWQDISGYVKALDELL